MKNNIVNIQTSIQEKQLLFGNIYSFEKFQRQVKLWKLSNKLLLCKIL